MSVLSTRRISRLRIASVVAVLAFLSGCSTTSSVSKFSEVLERPEQTTTQITEHLACFGDMLSDYQRAYAGGKTQPLRVAIVSVKDATDISTIDFANSEIPSDFRDMTLGIASKIGGPLRVLHVPDSNEIIDGLRLAGSAPEGYKPFAVGHYGKQVLQIYGALTEYDRLLSNKQRELDLAAEFGDGTGLTNAEASRFKEKNTARMTMDFRMVQGAVGDILNHVSSTNTLRLYQKGSDWSFGISVDGQGIGYAKTESVVDARHKAIRLLIELGIIQTIGRYAKVPYWKCLTPEYSHAIVKVKDLLEQQTGNYSFFAEIEPPKGAEIEEDACAKDNSCIDNRDKSLMMTVAADYEYAEFINLGARAFVARPSANFSLQGDANATQLQGRKQKLNTVLSLYRSNSPAYDDISSDEELVTVIKESLMERGILSEFDETYSTELFLALWANAPVSRGARWRLN